jgi:hypothetical protein
MYAGHVEQATWSPSSEADGVYSQSAEPLFVLSVTRETAHPCFRADTWTDAGACS